MKSQTPKLVLKLWFLFFGFIVFITFRYAISGELLYWPLRKTLNIGMFLVGAFSLFLFSKVYTKFKWLRVIFPFILSLGCASFAMNALFADGFMATHDGTGVFLSFTAFFKNLVYQSHQLPRWLHYAWMGVPCLRFYSPLFFWSSLFFPFLDAITTLKILIFASFFFSALSIFYLSNEIYGGVTAASISSLAYSLNGYHLLVVLIRGALAEAFNFIWFPVILFFFWRICRGQKILSSILLGGLSLALSVLTHFLTAYLFSVFLLIYFISLYIRSSNKRVLICFILMMLLAVFLTSWFIIPFLVENHLVLMSGMSKSVRSPVTITHFVSLEQIFLRRVWKYPNTSPEWSVYFGNVILYLSFGLIIIRNTKKVQLIKNKLIPLLLFAIAIIVYDTPHGKWVSDLLHLYPFSIFIEAHQFSVRTFTILSLITSLLSGITVAEIINILEISFDQPRIGRFVAKLVIILTIGLLILDVFPFTGVMAWEENILPEEGANYIFGKLRKNNDPFRIWSDRGYPLILINHYSDRLYEAPFKDWSVVGNNLLNEAEIELREGRPPRIQGYLSLKYIITQTPLSKYFRNKAYFKVIDSYTSKENTTIILLENLLFRPFFEISDGLKDIDTTAVPSEIITLEMAPSIIQLKIKMNTSYSFPLYLTVKESYYPGWAAYVNGSRVKVVSTKNGLLAVAIPQGTVYVRLVFERTIAEKLGISITLLGTFAIISLLIYISKPKSFLTLR